MDKKIVPLVVHETTDEHVLEILDAAKQADFRQIVIIGVWGDGEFDVSHSAMTDQDLNWLIDLAKKAVLEGE